MTAAVVSFAMGTIISLLYMLVDATAISKTAPVTAAALRGACACRCSVLLQREHRRLVAASPPRPRPARAETPNPDALPATAASSTSA
jgi:hypothetical protein